MSYWAPDLVHNTAGVLYSRKPQEGFKAFYYDGKRIDKNISWSGVFYYLYGVPENLLEHWNALGGGYYEYKPSLFL